MSRIDEITTKMEPFADAMFARPGNWVPRDEHSTSWFRDGMVSRAWLYVWDWSDDTDSQEEYEGYIAALDTLMQCCKAMDAEQSFKPELLRLIEEPANGAASEAENRPDWGLLAG